MTNDHFLKAKFHLKSIAAQAYASRLVGREQTCEPETVEQDFIQAFAAFAGVWIPGSADRCRVTYSATTGLVEVAGVLQALGRSVVAHEPHLQFIRRIFERHGLAVFGTTDIEDALERVRAPGKRPAALFLTAPSNPTGSNLFADTAQVDQVLDACAVSGTIVVLDLTLANFGLSRAGYGRYPIYQALESSGVEYITIEDAGKTLSLDHIKCGLIFCSAGVVEDLKSVHDDILDYVSPSILAVLGRVYREMEVNDLCPHLAAVAHRWQSAPLIFEGLEGVTINYPSVRLNFAWLKLNGADAEAAARSISARHGLHVTSGKDFYSNRIDGEGCLRVNLEGLECAQPYSF